MAYKKYVQITGLENWLPLHECLGLEVFNSFIMLNGESPHVQACFDAAEQEHTIRIKLEKKKAAERRMKAKTAREDKLAVHDLVQQVRSGDANASVVPETSPTSLSSPFVALDDCACQQSCGPPLKKPRLTRSTSIEALDCEKPLRPLIPPQLEAAAKNMADLGTQEVHLYEQQLLAWENEEMHEQKATQAQAAADAFWEYEEMLEQEAAQAAADGNFLSNEVLCSQIAESKKAGKNLGFVPA